MHGFIRVAVVSPKVSVANPKANVDEIINILNKLEEDIPSIVVFPELSITGYTCGDLFGQKILLEEAESALLKLVHSTRPTGWDNALIFVGMPLVVNNALYNCAVAINDGVIVGVVPKQYLPNYKEFYEARWFHPAIDNKITHIDLFGQKVPFGTDLIFKYKTFKVFAEVCEDIWMPIPPSSHAAIAGANILCNLSASNETVAKSDYRRDLIVNQSARCMAAYLYASSGPSESTSDLVFGGHCLIAENGSLLAESNRVGNNMSRDSYWAIQEIDVESLEHDRRQTTSFAYSPSKEFREINTHLYIPNYDLAFRKVNKTPFIPSDKTTLDRRCQEIIDIAVCGLVKRLEMLQSTTKLMIGVSGGLDSTLALLFLHKAAKLLGIQDRILAYTMPGFGTTTQTLDNALKLMNHLGIKYETVDIRLACIQMFKDLNHKPFGISDWDNETTISANEKLAKLPKDANDLVFENVQARIRTSLLMNKGFVIGTGDLSELALGWCTYNADHMSMYNPNCSIPKTLVKFLIQYIADSDAVSPNQRDILYNIIKTPVSPELLPTHNGEIVQVTENVVGPYELNDFFLYNFVRKGFSPVKILYLANIAFKEKYDYAFITKTLKEFYSRFFRNQFKRNCVPDGPKVGSVSLSPRGDWRMPSDADSRMWVQNVNSFISGVDTSSN